MFCHCHHSAYIVKQTTVDFSFYAVYWFYVCTEHLCHKDETKLYFSTDRPYWLSIPSHFCHLHASFTSASTIFKIKLFFTFITFHGLTILAALPIPQLDLTILLLWGGRKWTVRERKRKGNIEGENSPLYPCMYPQSWRDIDVCGIGSILHLPLCDQIIGCLLMILKLIQNKAIRFVGNWPVESHNCLYTCYSM